jgi:uncharacterized membrane protein
MSRSKLIIVALLVSVAINLVFVGGISYRASSIQDFGPRPFPPNVGWVVRDLSEERRSELDPILRQSYDEIRPIRGEMFQAQRRVNELMASASFDAEALDQAFAELRDAGERYQTLSHQQTIAIFNELTEEERQMAQQFVQRRGPREGRERFRGGDGRPGFGARFGPDGPRGPGGRPPPSPPPDPDQ